MVYRVQRLHTPSRGPTFSFETVVQNHDPIIGPVAYSITGEVGESRIDSRARKAEKKTAEKPAVKRMTLEEAMKNQALRDKVEEKDDTLSFED